MSASGKVVKTKLFIGNLDQATQTAELTELFSSFGNVLEASVIKDYGFVHYGTIDEAEKAVAGLNNKEFRGKRLRVELSTSTVRHRPGQPEPASALRHSRARHATTPSGNGVSRYALMAPPSGVGPMRHNASNWIRNDIRPYANIPREAGADYGLPPLLYDRAHPHDVRSEPRRYYPDARDHGYAAEYETPSYGSSRNGDYRDLPSHARVESIGYGPNRSYDRHTDLPATDPYYDGAVSRGSPATMDPRHSYELYQKFYATRARDPEFLGPAGVSPSPRDYDIYANYRHDPYGSVNGQATFRHHSNVTSPPQHRQQQLYPSGSSSSYAPPPPPPHHPHYYGAHQRA